jgi:hypothetical protein
MRADANATLSCHQYFLLELMRSLKQFMSRGVAMGDGIATMKT